MSLEINKNEEIKKLKKIYELVKCEVIEKINDFKRNFKDREKFLKEFIFCLLTPQSKAENAWRSVEELFDKKILFTNDVERIAEIIKNVRFRINKSKYIVENANRFFNNDYVIIEKIKSSDNVMELREWLVKNVKGYGFKEASHFLRNIGKGENIAILDRHILKSLLKLNIIENIPETMNKKVYYQIEEDFKNFALRIDIPVSHLDFVFWYEVTGRIFK